jgi:predicted DNA-binding protein
MKASNLPDLWATLDNSRVTSKQYSFRLPVHVAAKIEALCEMYPGKNRTQIVADLLTSALDEVERGFPVVEAGDPIGHDPDGELIYEDVGPRSHFRDLANRHYMELETELGNPTPTPLYR